MGALYIWESEDDLYLSFGTYFDRAIVGDSLLVSLSISQINDYAMLHVSRYSETNSGSWQSNCETRMHADSQALPC